MNIAATILVCGVGFALAACDVATASHDRTEDVTPLTVANREVAKAQEQDDARVADAHAAARREINEAAFRLSWKQAKADYRDAVAKADGELSIAVKKCPSQPVRARTACETNARSMRDQSVEMAKVKLSLADQ
jgi:hypothetical protein